MDYFPEETVAEARRIASLYRARWKDARTWAVKLYDSAFLELSYGFEDAIKRGVCGHFLHEAVEDVECFSLAGINYIMARELGLKPKLYDTRDMRDVEYGQSPLDKMVADHCFISVNIGGKEMALDPNEGLLGEMKWLDNKLIILKEDDLLGKIPVERTYSSITELSEEQYVEEMRKHQSPDSGKATLVCGQVVHANRMRVMVQYLPSELALSASIHAGINNRIMRESVSRVLIHELVAPVEDDGSWTLEQGKLNVYNVRSPGWMREQNQLVHRFMSYDYKTVRKFRENLEIAARHFGRSSPITTFESNDRELYFRRRGFSGFGEVVGENGVDARKHHLLLEELLKGIPLGDEPEEAREEIALSALYTAASIGARRDDNPYGFVYPEAERTRFIDEHLDDLQEMYTDYGNKIFMQIVANSGLRQGGKRISRQLLTIKSRREQIDKFRSCVERRKRNVPAFNQAIDIALFETEHPLGSAASEEELLTFYRNEVFMDMCEMTDSLPTLELHKYRKGLKKLLARR